MALAPSVVLVLSEICPDLEAASRRFWSKVEKSDQCWIWTGARMRTGYGRFWVGGGSIWQAHRFAALLSMGELPAGALVLHRCDNPPCVRADHLYLGTNADNNADMSARERFNLPLLQGALNNQSKLTEETVREMRARFHQGESRTALGRAFGVTRQTATDAINGVTWGWVT